MLDPQLDADGNLIHLLSTEGLSKEQLTRLLDTGASFLGGDWVLEAQTGDINAPTIQLESFDQTLGASVSYSFSSSSGRSGSPAYMTATGVTYTSGGTLVVKAYDVDYAQGELDVLSISYDNGANWTRLYNNFGDSYLRGSTHALLNKINSLK